MLLKAWLRPNLVGFKRCLTIKKIGENKDYNMELIEQIFISPIIQTIFKRINRQTSNIYKIYAPSPQSYRASTIKLLPKSQIDKLIQEQMDKAQYKLRCPPIVAPRKPIKEFICKNKELQGLNDAKMVFTDITYSSTLNNNNNRFIIVRQPDGTLRRASWKERDRMNQIYFPIPGRQLRTPKLFEDDTVFEYALKRGIYVELLDRITQQFDPDDPRFLHFISQVFNHIIDANVCSDKTGNINNDTITLNDSVKGCDTLISTRYFTLFIYYCITLIGNINVPILYFCNKLWKSISLLQSSTTYTSSINQAKQNIGIETFQHCASEDEKRLNTPHFNMFAYSFENGIRCLAHIIQMYEIIHPMIETHKNATEEKTEQSTKVTHNMLTEAFTKHSISDVLLSTNISLNTSLKATDIIDNNNSENNIALLMQYVDEYIRSKTQAHDEGSVKIGEKWNMVYEAWRNHQNELKSLEISVNDLNINNGQNTELRNLVA